MKPETSSLPALHLDEKRQVIYAALMRFSDVAIELRQRALWRIVLSALIGSTVETPYKLEKIKRNLNKRREAPTLQDRILTETLHELWKDNQIQRFEQKSSKAYCLTPAGAAEVAVALKEAADVFEPVLERMLRHTDPSIPLEVRASLCQAFIVEAFARFGRQIAYSVTGRAEGNEILAVSQIDAVFEAVSAEKKLSPDGRDSMHVACKNFISSSEPEDGRLRLCLTQGYFLAELLCVDKAAFLPLSKQAFEDAVFYLDTNVLFIGLLAIGNHSEEFEEMLRLANRLGIELRVTKATLNEAHRVLASRRGDLEKYRTMIPQELTDLTHDRFLSAYQEQMKLEPEVTLGQFFDRLDRRTVDIENEWPIHVDNRTEDQILGNEALHEWAEVMQEEARVSKQSEKTDQVLRHDLALFVLIRAERQKKPKTWLLTIDQSLMRTASKLMSSARSPKSMIARQGANGGGSPAGLQKPTSVDTDSMPFCFSLAAFLQSISPFTTTKEEHSLADIFSGLVQEYLSVSKNLFEAREMNLLMDMHHDLMITPNEQLVPALTLIKTNILKGREYTAEHATKVGFELRKILHKNAVNRERLAIEARRTLEQKVEESQRNADILKEEMKRDRTRAVSRLWRDRAAMGLVIAAVVWFFQDNIVTAIVSKGLDPERSTKAIYAAVSILAASALIVPSVLFVKSTPWRTQSKVVVGSLIVLVVISLARFITDASVSRWGSWLQLAISVGAIVNLISPRKEE